MSTECQATGLDTAEIERLRQALDQSDDRLHETTLGGFQVRGRAEYGRLLLCHGAGAGHDSMFLTRLRQRLAAAGIQVVAVEFGYMTKMRREGTRRPPPKIDTLVDELAEWRRVLTSADTAVPLWLGGKSMGGRVASLLASRSGAAGLVLCGYPFHPPGKPERLRLDHWPAIDCPLMLLQGTRDPFGCREEVENYTLPAHVECHFLEGGDHDWKPPKRQPQTQATLIDQAAALIARRLCASR